MSGVGSAFGAVAQSSLVTALKRYSRSWGLWLLLLVGPIGARFFVGRDDGSSVTIAVGNHLPVLTSAMLGVSLGIVVSTLLLPVAFLYLRANTTRCQPWQIEEVSPASRVAITLGRFGADMLVLFGVLAALNLGGWLLGWLVITVEPVNFAQISFALWLVAAPAVMGLAAIRQLFDALPWTRRALGDFLYLWVWLASIAVPAAAQHMPAGFASNMYDFAGFVRPLVYGAPAGSDDFAIGGGAALPGRVSLDVMAGLLSPGYIPSRLAWAAIAVALAAFAGLLYRPHRSAKRRWYATLADRLTAQPVPPRANPNAPPASAARVPLLELLRAEFTLIGGGRLLLLLGLGAAIAGLAADYRHVGSAAANLWLIFALTAHAGRTEPKGLRALTMTTALSPTLRRAAFVAAGMVWALAMALPGALWNADAARLPLALATGGVVALVSMALSAVSGSGFAARMLLLVVWYGYLST